MATAALHTLSLVLLCIIMTHTDLINCAPINHVDLDSNDNFHSTQLLENITGSALPQIIDLLQIIASTHQNATTTASNVLPSIVALLKEDNNLHAFHNHLMANSSAMVTPNIVELVSLMQNQQNMQERQNQLLENTSASLQKVATLLQDLPPILANIVQVQQDMHPQLINKTSLLPPRDATPILLPRDGSNRQQTTSPMNIKITTPQPQDVTSLPNYCSGDFSTGQQTISPVNNELSSFKVYCDMDTDGGGWIVFQRRCDGSVQFYHNWKKYENGFGSIEGEFWLGLKKLHVLTSRSQFELMIQLEDFDGNRAYAHYDDFQVGNSSSFYRLTIGSYSGTAGDAMTYLNGSAFTTKSQDHDTWRGGNCAIYSMSGWWQKNCNYANLNGMYRGHVEVYKNSRTCIYWYHWKNSLESLKKSEMKIRLKKN